MVIKLIAFGSRTLSPHLTLLFFLLENLSKAGIDIHYVAGNHDWHYEGMSGKLDTLRDTWIDNRVLSLYQGKNRLMAAYDIKGIRFLAISSIVSPSRFVWSRLIFVMIDNIGCMIFVLSNLPPSPVSMIAISTLFFAK